MNTLKLSEIIRISESDDQSVSLECIARYKKSLLTYFRRYYRNGEPMLLVTDVFNAIAYAKVVPESDFSDALETYVNSIPDLTEEEREAEREIISFNSRPLARL